MLLQRADSGSLKLKLHVKGIGGDLLPALLGFGGAAAENFHSD